MEKFLKSFQENCEVSTGTCRNYAYQLKYLTEHGGKLDDVNSCLECLKDEGDSRKSNALTALKVYYKRVKKDNDSYELLTEPFNNLRKRVAEKRRK